MKIVSPISFSSSFFGLAKVFSNFEISYNMIFGFKITEVEDGKTRS